MSTQIPHHADPQQNELAHWFNDFQRKIEPHTNKIVLAIILATVAFVAYQVFERSAAAKTAAAWSEYYTATTPDEYNNVADEHAGSPIESWCRLEAARGYIRKGVGLSMTNRIASDESLESGKTQLEKLLNSKTTPLEVREQALSQMAVCLESLSDGDVKPAIEAYERLLKEFPDTYFGPTAKYHMEQLKKPSTAEFYAWFRKAKPAPPERPKPQDVKPGEMPNVQLLPGGSDPLPPSTSGTAPIVPETKPAEGTPVTPEAPVTPVEVPAVETPEVPVAPVEAPAVEAPATPVEAPAVEAPAAPVEATPVKPPEPAVETPKP